MLMFQPETNVSEAGTGAVRSNDLAVERWDLISWPAIDYLVKGHHKELYGMNPGHLVGLSIRSIRDFLSGDGSVSDLGRGWACLAAAIQQIDLPNTTAYDAWMQSLAKNSGWAILPYFALQRLSTTCHEGAVKYGEHNWLYGFPITNLLNHALRHLIKWTNGDRTEDHLGHTMWGFMASVHMYEYRPDMCKGLLGPGMTHTHDITKALEAHAAHRSKKNGS
jgi:hypothetical protein